MTSDTTLGVELNDLVSRLERAISLGTSIGARGKSPHNIYNIADEALTALRALSANRTAVKPLGWDETFQDRGDGSSELSGWEAETPGFSVFYTIEIEVSVFALRRQDLDVTDLGTFTDPDEAKAAAQADYERRVLSALVEPAPTHRHKKRGSEYVLIGIGKIQAEDWREHGLDANWPTTVDMREVAIYRSIDDGSLWARPREEFEDGRFEKINTEGE